jgi:hypothetical protein
LHRLSKYDFISKMPKLSQIIGPFAEALWVTPKSVNVLAMLLRKHGLITSAGRGSAGAEMGASDATNLLLAVMRMGPAKNVHHNVRFIRKAQLKARHYGKTPLKKKDKIPLLVNGFEGDLGRTLDALFEVLIEKKEPLLEATAFDLDVPATGEMHATIWLHKRNCDEAWSLGFGRYMDLNHDAKPGLMLIASLRHWVIHAIADIVRGDLPAPTEAA